MFTILPCNDTFVGLLCILDKHASKVMLIHHGVIIISKYLYSKNFTNKCALMRCLIKYICLFVYFVGLFHIGNWNF